MTIEEEIRQRLRAMGMDEESLEPCLLHIKADPLCRGLAMRWSEWACHWPEDCRKSFWVCAHSSALDYLEKKYHVEARKEFVADQFEDCDPHDFGGY